MGVTWRSAVRYALTVVIGSWLIGAGVDLAWAVVAGGLDAWVSFRVGDPWSYAFLAGATLTLTLVRRWTDPMPVWCVPLIDGGAYLLVLLLWGGLTAWRYGAAVPADDAFLVATLAMLDLQLPSAWLLIFWRSRHLRVVLTRDDGGTTAARAADH